MEATQRKKRKSRHKKKRLAFLFLLVVVAIGLLGGLSFTVLFPVRHVSVNGSGYYSNEQLLQALGFNEKTQLFSVRKEAVLKKVQAALPYIDDVTIERQLPDTLVLNFTDTAVFYRISYDNKAVLCDSRFRVVEEDSAINVIPMRLVCPFAIEKDRVVLDEEHAAVVKALTENASNNAMTLNEVNIQSLDSLSVRVNDRFLVKLGGRNDLEGKILHLAGMMRSMSEDDKGVVDLSEWAENNHKGYFIKAFDGD